MALDQNSQGWAVCFAISYRKQKILTALHEHMLLSNVEKHFVMKEDQSQHYYYLLCFIISKKIRRLY